VTEKVTDTDDKHRWGKHNSQPPFFESVKFEERLVTQNQCRKHGEKTHRSELVTP